LRKGDKAVGEPTRRRTLRMMSNKICLKDGIFDDMETQPVTKCGLEKKVKKE
jgi:hypothetical protein